MKFILSPENRRAEFGDVGEDQMFVDDQGVLRQKKDENSYCTIANPDGTLFCTVYEGIEKHFRITRIITNIQKIEF